MRRNVVNNGVTVQAIGGNHGVFLGFDLDATASPGCLGFGVQRRTVGPGNVLQWLPGFKTFKSVEPNPSSKQVYLSDAHPVQSFWWGDYTTVPGTTYEYRVVPVYGSPANPSPKQGVDATVQISTSDPDQGTHGIYFNRGVAASQAYSEEFGKRPDDLPEVDRARAMSWLSRGLHEAMVSFIGQASSAGFALRASAFEFTEPGVLTALQDAADAGADVQVIYHAKDDSTGRGNAKAIANSHFDQKLKLIARDHAALSHNKFIVLCTKSAAGDLTPVSVWTGSTNLSQGGIFGHSNVGHAVRDAGVAAQYLTYWDEVQSDPEGAPLRAWVGANNPFAAIPPTQQGVSVIFSPRTGLAPLNWYADRFGKAATSAHLTLAFGMTDVIEQALNAAVGNAMHFVILDKADDHQAIWTKHRGVLAAVGAMGGPDSLTRWAEETLTGFNKSVLYSHTKILLVDPLSANPTVITGSANFSPASTDANDENMLVINGDLEVADVYFTEYTRMFQHFYSRYWAAKLAATGGTDEGSFLAEDAAWQDKYAVAGSAKRRQRDLFSAGVDGNV